MKVVHGFQIQVGEDIGIVDDKRFIAIKEFSCLHQATSRIEKQVALITNVNIKSEILFFF